MTEYIKPALFVCVRCNKVDRGPRRLAITTITTTGPLTEQIGDLCSPCVGVVKSVIVGLAVPQLSRGSA